MIPRIRLPLAGLALLGATSGAALAAVPAPWPVSDVRACMLACPFDYFTFPTTGPEEFLVIVRDLNSNVLAGASVTIDLSECPGAYVCDVGTPTPYTYDPVQRTLRMFTDALGRAKFDPRVGGGCGPGSVKVYANGVLLRSIPLASPDQDGDGLAPNLLNQDYQIFQSKLGTSDPTADFDCDGDVDSDDELIIFQHGAHSCFGFVDAAQRRTWGRVKSFYR